MRRRLILVFITFCSINLAQNLELTPLEAQKILQLPLHCIETEYPNKTGQSLSSAEDLGTPRQLHPIFYGCYDWHSAVHGYWSIIQILKRFPELDADNAIKNKLIQNFAVDNVFAEVAYFQREQEYSFERTYGWAWLLKLQEALDTWETEEGIKLSLNLQPLTDLIVEKYKNYLPKLVYPIRVGTHTNTAFGLSFAYDYAVHSKDADLQQVIRTNALRFYANDKNCPIHWEPDGHDFLSPCMEEIDIMRKIMGEEEFKKWLPEFLPEITSKEFDWEVAIVSDRSDGHLVHLDGLNFSRAWVFFGLAKQYPEFNYLRTLGEKHFLHSYPQIIEDTYEGGHWLGSFALYALLVDW